VVRNHSHVDDAGSVGRRLREARERAGLSQRDVAFDGCSPAYISRIESGARVPSLQVLRELARRTSVSESHLAWGESEPVTPVDPLSEAELTLRLEGPAAARRRARQVLQGATDARTRARALALLGQAAFEEGDHAEATEQFEAALKEWPALVDEEPAVADSLGRAYGLRSEHETAIALFERQLEAAKERRDLIEAVRFSVLLANTLADRGLFGRAEEVLGHALALAGDLGDSQARARLWWTQSRLHALQDDAPRAERYARLALDTLVLGEHARYAALAHQVLAHIKLNGGEAEEALALLERAWPLIADGGNAYELGLFQIERARALAQLGRLEEARVLAELASDQLRDASPEDAARGLLVLAEIHARRGEVEEAIATYRRAVAAFSGPHRYKLEAYSRLGELLKAQGRKDEALEVFSEAMRLQAEAAPIG
jgi:tetratricopeptide (TPR) repeat protein/DNA-binding XRE family transcriptional regulator